MSVRAVQSRASWPGVFAVYGGAFVVGATLDSFPASSAYLVALRGFSDQQYGAIYLPQLIAAIVGAVGGGMASRRFALHRLFHVAMSFFLISQILLIVCGWPGTSLEVRTALIVVMAATAAFGFGFGVGGGPLNGLVTLLFPKTPNSAITALHMCAGAGLTIAPLIFSRFAAAGHWAAGVASLSVVTVLVLLLAFLARLPDLRASLSAQNARVSPVRDPAFWVLVIAAVAYALVEGTFSNWAVLYVQDDLRMAASVAAGALTAFWGGLTIGRLASSIISLRVKPMVFLCVLPLCMIGALFVIRSIDSPAMALAGFAVAGLACSAFFPMLVGFAAEGSPDHVSWLAAMLTAALMTGVGLGSYAIGALHTSVPIRVLYAGAVVYPAIALVAVLVASRIKRMKSLRRSAPRKG